MFKKLSKISNLEEIKSLYYSTLSKNKKKEILRRWNEIFVPKLEKAIETNNPEDFFRTISFYAIPPEGEACDIKNREMKKFISLITDIKQADYFYNIIHCNEIYDIWINLSKTGIEKANSPSEMKNIFYYLQEDHKEEALVKWFELCQTIEEFIEFIESNYRWKTKEITIKIESMLLQAIPQIQNIETARKYYYHAPDHGAAKVLLVERWLDLCKTPEETSELYSIIPNSMLTCKKMIYKKVKDLTYNSNPP
jgi:hypothetical protein